MSSTLKVHTETKLRTFNNALTVIVIALGVYIMIFPFLPHLDLWLDKAADNTGGVRYSGLLAQENNVADDNLVAAPEDNRLVIPGIQVDNPLILGSDPENVNRGVWHRPHTSTPDQGGNTVLVAHRFSYNSPATFYHLDKMANGDTFAVWWEGQEYVYEVFETVVVDATAIEIESNTEEPIVTLYTCTPVWTAVDRLVVKARLVNTDILEQETTEVGALHE